MMRVKLSNRIGCELIPLNNTFAVHMLSEDYPLIVEDMESNESYQTAIVKYYEYQSNRLIVRTQNTRYEFEVI